MRRTFSFWPRRAKTDSLVEGSTSSREMIHIDPLTSARWPLRGILTWRTLPFQLARPCWTYSQWIAKKLMIFAALSLGRAPHTTAIQMLGMSTRCLLKVEIHADPT